MCRPFCLLAAIVLLALGGCRTASRVPAAEPIPASPPPTELGIPARLTLLAVATPIPASSPGLTPIPPSTTPGAGLPQPTRPPSPTSAPPKPTSTPTPLPPTPTALPSAPELLQSAQRAQQNGYLDEAARLYQAFLSAYLQNSGAASARLELGKLHLARGKYQEATQVLEGFPAGSRPPQALFLLGEAQRLQGRWTTALNYYQEYAQASPTGIGSYLRLRLAETHLQAGQEAQSIALYEEAASDKEFLLPQRVAAMEKLAQLELVRGNHAQAIAWYERILALAQVPAYRAKIEYLRAQAYMAWGKDALAQEHLLALAKNYPTTSQAYLALRELSEENRAKLSHYQRGLIYLYNADYPAALKAFHGHIDAGYDIAEAHYYAARAYRLAGEPRPALQELDVMLSTHAYTESAVMGKGWLEKAQVEELLGQPKGALATFKNFARRHPADALASEALWQAAKLEEKEGNLSEALATYSSLAKGYPGGPYGMEASFRLGLCHFRLGNYGKAMEAWEELKARPMGSEEKAKVLLWLGKAELKAGKEGEARTHLAAAIQAGPYSFYGLRARDILAGAVAQKSPGWDPQRVPAPVTLQGKEALEKWLATWAGAPPAWLSGGPGPSSIQRLKLGRELLALGLRPEALAELAQAKAEAQSDPWALYRLAVDFSEDGVYHLSISAAAGLLRLSPAASALEAPPLLAHLLYPTYYGDLVLAQAQEKGLDPLLVFALIHQESLFDAAATSSANARGLTQVIPPTGSWIAKKIGWADFSPDELYRPYVSLEFGAWYLAEQLKTFQGNPFLALAAYNGGPTNAACWQDPDPDLFLEKITLAESEKYVRKVYEHYAFYQALYRPAGRP